MAFAALALSALLGAASLDVRVPASDGWVTDLAGMLSSAQERELESLMESYREGSTHEIALLTLTDLDGETIERTALEVAREWGLGSEDEHNGALFVVAQAERKIRIEVGRGLEGALPDALCGRIIADVVTPAFRRGDFAGGLHEGVVAIHAAIGGDYGPLERGGGKRARSLGSGALVVFLVVVVLLIVARRRRDGGEPIVLGDPLAGGPRHMSAGGFGGFGGGFGGGGGGGFGGFGGGGGFSGGGASGGW